MKPDQCTRPLARTSSRRGFPLAIALLLLLAAFGPTPRANAAPAAEPQPTRSTQAMPGSAIYVPETGQAIEGAFLNEWVANGLEAGHGFPISGEFVAKNGRTVQYYEYARYEYIPDDPYGDIIQPAKIGYELRPVTLPRNTFGSAPDPMAAIARAWVPLDTEKLSLKPATAEWRFFPETGHSLSKDFKTFWETGSYSTLLGMPLTEPYLHDGTTFQVFEYGQLASEKGKPVWRVKVGDVLATTYRVSTDRQPQGDLMTYPEYVEFMSQERWIDVNLSTQYMVAYQGSTPVMETYVSTGRPGFDTPTGTYYVWVKLESETMTGTLGGEYYYVPDVPWVMYFTDRGHAIHGAYWHSNFGQVMSHGCINLPVETAQWLWYWAPMGMRIEIHY